MRNHAFVSLAQYLLPCKRTSIRHMILGYDEEFGNQTFNAYGTPVVSIRKALLPRQQKAKIRVCGDYSVTVNAQLEIHRQPMPLPEDLMRKLSGGYFFTKVDLADAYNQIKLSPESQKK